MNKQNLHVFFRRVSTTNQDLAMQIELDRPYRERLTEDEMYVIDEDGVSANKLSIEERPKMLELISLIKADKVNTLYAYDRTRIARNMYDAMEFNDICEKHKINIIYTSTADGHMAYSNNNLMECFLFMFGDIEGKNIARRTKEAHRRYPPKKYGYIKNKEANDKIYQKDTNKSSLLENFFHDLKQVQSYDDMRDVILSFKEVTKRDEEQIIKLAIDPFYAGLDIEPGKSASDLPHVDSYLTKDEYYAIQEQITEYITTYAEKLKQIKKSVIDTQIHCGHCHKPMRLKIKPDRSDSYYRCVTKHPKRQVEYTSTELNEGLVLTVYQIIEHLDANRLISESKIQMKYIKDEVSKEVNRLHMQIKEIEDVIFFSTKDYQQDWNQNDSAKDLTSLEEEVDSLERKLAETEWLLTQNKKMVSQIEQALLNQSSVNVDLLKQLFIKEVILFDDHIDIEVYTFKYLKDMDKQLIQRKDEPACK